MNGICIESRFDRRFFEGPNGELDWHVVENEFFQYAAGLLRSVAGMLYGRKTYEHMAEFWSTAPSDEIADQMNALPKLVFSNSLERAVWNNSRIVRTDAGEEVRRLKENASGDYVILGSSELVSSLLRDGLIDEYRMVVNPVILGRGKPQFGGIAERIQLRLERFQTLSSGVVILSYHPLRWTPTTQRT